MGRVTVSHPRTLQAFALGALDDPACEAVLDHLASCGSCRREVRRIREAAARAADTLDPVAPDGALRGRVLAAARPHLEAARRRPVPAPRRPGLGAIALAALAAVAVLASAGVAWDQHRSFLRAESERAIVAAWLTRDDVTTWRLDPAGAGERSPGSVMVADDATVLVVLRGPPPAGSSYHVWGHGESGPTRLGIGTGTVLRVVAAGYAEVAVSIEPRRDAAAPTATLGRVPLPAGS
jgi:hypothetical protein